jgi:hypothetical protein
MDIFKGLRGLFKPSRSHKQRVQRVKVYAGKNKIFTVFAIIAVLFLVGNFLLKKDSTPPEKETEQTEIVEAQTQTQSPTWRFYWLDLGVLAVGGGFCFVMILRQKRKERNEI